MLHLPAPDLMALVTGEIVAAFTGRAAAGEGDEVELLAEGTRPAGELKPAYVHWVDAAPGEGWTAVVHAVHPASGLDAAAGEARHILAAAPASGDLLVLRVYAADGEPVLSDTAFAARARSLEAALR